MEKFKNEIQVLVRAGSTGEVIASYEKDNAISDDILAEGGHLIVNSTLWYQNPSAPFCFILKDGPRWSGFTFDRTNPWAPYSLSLSNSTDTSANNHYASRTYTAPWGTGNPTPKHKFFYRWTKLADDFQLRGIGLTWWQSGNSSYGYGITANIPNVFVPQTLVVLPNALLVRGRKNGTQTPDILEISYFLSVVGAS